MSRDNRVAGTPSGRRRPGFRPAAEGLEDRKLLTTVSLTTTQSANLGEEFIGKAANDHAGFTVTDVGDVTGSGYDDFVVSAPGVDQATIGATPTFGAGESAAYLIFGSKAVNSTTVTAFLTNLTAATRAGDLGTLGQLLQVNPTVAQPTTGVTTFGFNFDGLTLVTGLDATTGLGRNSALGFSVAALGDVNGDGLDDFAISAPNDAGGGRVFVIYGNRALATQATTAKTLDLEPTAGTTITTAPTTVLSFSLGTGVTGTTDVGYSVGSIGNYFQDGSIGLAIGAPGYTTTGAAFAIEGSFLNSLASGTNTDLATVAAAGGRGIEYTGINAGELLGTSVGTAGSFDGALATGVPLDDLLLGAPGVAGGNVYVVYANQTTTANLPLQQLGTVQTLTTLGATPGTNPVTTPLQGVVFQGLVGGARFGYSLAAAGDFDRDGAGDIFIGAPGNGTGSSTLGTGYAALIYGVLGTSTTSRLNGVFSVDPSLAGTTAYRSAYFTGIAAGDFTGYSVATNFSRVLANGLSTASLLIGAPGYNSFGTAYYIPTPTVAQGVLLNLQPLSTVATGTLGTNGAIQYTDPETSGEGLGTSVSLGSISNSFQGSTSGGFDVFIGAPNYNLLNPSLTTQISRQAAGIAFAIEGGVTVGSGSTTTGGGTGTTTGTTGNATLISPTAFGILAPPVFTGINGGLASPPLSSLSHLSSYQPLPVQLAFQQFRAAPGFGARINLYHNPDEGSTAHQAAAGTVLNVAFVHYSEDKYAKKETLPHNVFTRGKFHYGKAITFTHHIKVVPNNLQHERLQAPGIPTPKNPHA